MKQIIISGGGGFTMDDVSFDVYVAHQAKKENPKICILPTASGDSPSIIKGFIQLFRYLGCETSYLSLFCPPSDIESKIMSQDIIYVPGGHTKSMLALWKDWGVDKLLKRAYENGIVLAGTSAGSVCWFENFISDAYPDRYIVLEGLGLLKGSHAPHYSNQNGRRREYKKHIASGQIKGGYGLDNGVSLHFVDGEIFKILKNNDNGEAYMVEPENGKAVEVKLDASEIDQESCVAPFFNVSEDE